MAEMFEKKNHNNDILLVDDNPLNLTVLTEFLTKKGFKVRATLNGKAALKSIDKKRPDLILLDIMMPGIGGYEVCEILKEDDQYKDIPIIFISALDDVESKIKAFAIGGVDYITKPFEFYEVLARVQTRLELCRLQTNLEKLVNERTRQLDIYRKIVSTSKEFLSFIGTDYRYQFINNSYKKNFDLSNEIIIGKTPAVIFGEDRFKKEIKPNLDKCLSGEHVNYQFKRPLPKDKYQVMDVFMHPYMDKNAQVAGCVVTTRDITEQKKYEHMINQAYSELDQIFNSAGDGMYLIDDTFSIIRANSAFHQMWNAGTDELIGKKCYDFFCYDICHTDQCHFKRIRNGEDRLEFDYSATLDDSTKKYFSMTAAPFRDTNKTLKGIVVNVKDITQRVEAEIKEKKREQQMIQTDKLAAIGVLAAGIAHEINNPNGVIMLNIPMLSSYWKKAEPAFDQFFEKNGDFKLGETYYSKMKNRVPYLMDQTLESSKRIKRIVSELKDFARQDLLEMTEININDVVKTAVSLVSSKIKKTTRNFEISYENNLNPVKGNFQRLEQVIINVLINACEAIKDSDKGIYINVSTDKQKKLAMIQIKDQGTGINQENMKNLFNPFFTTKRDFGGTGLGLSVSHGIITEHKGTMTFESKLGQGTVCTISLPMT